MPCLAISDDRRVGRNQTATPTPGGCDNHPVSRVGVKRTRQPRAIKGNRRFNRQQPHARGSESDIEPFCHLTRQAKTALFHQQGNLPWRDRRDAHLIVSPRIDDDALCVCTQLCVVIHHPYQDVGVQNDHRPAAQSDGSAAGRNGSSYASTEPRNTPRIGGFSSVRGAGESTATARPRLVMVTGSPSSRISLIRRRHLALNSAAPTIFATDRSRLVVHLKCT